MNFKSKKTETTNSSLSQKKSTQLEEDMDFDENCDCQMSYVDNSYNKMFQCNSHEGYSEKVFCYSSYK